ncbi:MAG: ribosomal protein S18-alanine N-acetyltransferase [Deltaproteobacteria bacterium]|nr:ribosomal protein S18-alanine N-acetyltransferase [Deltaproteobacteria bacterium]
MMMRNKSDFLRKNFRKTTKADIPRLFEIQDAGENFWTAERFSKEIHNDLSHNEVVLLNEIVVGFACLWILADTADLHNIFVAPNYRRRQIGSALMTHMEGLAREKQAMRLLLEVSSGNQPAQNLYNNFGFQAVGIRKKYYQSGDAILMEKSWKSV